MDERSCLVMTHGGRALDTGRPVVFLDRDGVLIENREHYVRSARDVEVLPHVASALRTLCEKFDVVLVTNQSVIGRGLAPREDVLALHTSLVARLGAGSRGPLGSVVCPHHPDDGCECRKPSPGLLRAAAETWGCALEGSWMVGDAETDVAAGAAVGARTVLVRTGRGAAQEERTRRLHPACLVTDSLMTAVDIVRGTTPDSDRPHRPHPADQTRTCNTRGPHD